VQHFDHIFWAGDRNAAHSRDGSEPMRFTNSNLRYDILICFSSGCYVTLCDFHREKAWDEWLRKPDHIVANVKDDLLKKLRSIADAETKTEYACARDELMQSPIWKNNQKLRDWFTNKWLKSCHVRIMFSHYFYFNVDLRKVRPHFFLFLGFIGIFFLKALDSLEGAK
jgi:hypothetical protein